MARMTEAQRIERDNEEAALVFFREALAGLPDPRRRQGAHYPLKSVGGIALMAMVCGADDAQAMETWGESNAQWLGEVLDLPHGPLTQDMFLAVFAALDPAAFLSVLLSWMELLRLRLRGMGQHGTVDGKTSRSSYDTPTGRAAIDTVSVWLCEEGLVLGQIKTADKSNELIAIPELLRVLDVRGATVTLDAMGCQTEIAKTLVDEGGHYLLNVKENQPALLQDLQSTFAQAADPRVRSINEPPRPAVEMFEEVDKGHGRIEERRIELCRDLDWMMTGDRWAALNYLVKVTRKHTDVAVGKTSTETAYYIGSGPDADVVRTARGIRGHRSIEGSLVWVLDMVSNEDQARHRARNLAQNFSTMRHFALNLLKRNPERRVGIANSRKRAGWDRGYLLQILTLETG